MPACQVSTCLWFAKNAEDAVRHYVSLVPGSAMGRITHAPTGYPGGRAGDVLTVEFTLAGTPLFALNGGEAADHTQAMSLAVACEDQATLDRVWEGLLADGGQPIMCGWLKDSWGVQWQVFPRRLNEMLADPDRAAATRAMGAMMEMVKLDLEALEAAFRGG